MARKIQFDAEGKPLKDYSIEYLKTLRKGTLTDDVLLKLEEGHKNDFTIEETCTYAGISAETYYNYCLWSSEFKEKMENAKRFLFIAAKKNIMNAVTKRANIDSSWKLLERRQKHIYAPSSEVTVKDPNKVLEDLEDEFKPGELEPSKV